MRDVRGKLLSRGDLEDLRERVERGEDLPGDLAYSLLRTCLLVLETSDVRGHLINDLRVKIAILAASGSGS